MKRLVRPIKSVLKSIRLTPRQKAELAADVAGLPSADPGLDAAIDAGAAWLARAQDMSTTRDGGVAKHFSLISGWSSSYPETTGYIVPTMIEVARLRGDERLRERAQRMIDWLMSIQLDDGSFPGGSIGSGFGVPVTFNTGQILIGLANAVNEFGGAFRGSMRRAADWLVSTQDASGAWPHNQSPLVRTPGEKTYDTHVAWGLFEAARVEPDSVYGEAGLKNVRWAITLQRSNGWFEKCAIRDPDLPATHTLGYTLRGILEANSYRPDPDLLAAAKRTADGLLGAMSKDGFLPGKLDRRWESAEDWACLTGTAQVATCWLLLWKATGEFKYLDAAYNANRYVRRTLKIEGDPDVRGGVKGSFPVDGDYDAWLYPNWAAKFMVDSCMLEKSIRQTSPTPRR